MTKDHGPLAEIWSEVARLADVWTNLPLMRRFAAPLPRNNPHARSGLTGLLQHMSAAGGMIDSRPLRLGSDVPMMLTVVPEDAPSTRPGELETWLNDAQIVEAAHRETVAWLRSRLPGYPLMPTPHLASGTHLTTDEFTYRLAWSRKQLRDGLQLRNASAGPAIALGASSHIAAESVRALRDLAGALIASEEFQRLGHATASLSPADRASLAASRREVTAALAPSAVDAHEPDLAIARFNFRREVVQSARSALTGSPREYVDAFEMADRMIETICSDIFGQFAVYGVGVISDVCNLSVNAESEPTVEFMVAESLDLHQGAVVWLDDPLVSDAVLLTRTSFAFNQVEGARVIANGSILRGTSEAWSRSGP